MNTLFDFMTHIKSVEYLLAIGFIALFILLWEALSARPFGMAIAAGREDLRFIRGAGARGAMRTLGHMAETPFIGLAYIAMAPVAFLYGVAMKAAEWRRGRR